jgi:hypothetical protein
MNLDIETAAVREVLLADGWHTVTRGTFRVGPRRFLPVGTGESGQRPQALEGGPGFAFDDKDGNVVSGPLSSLLAVVSAPPEQPEASGFVQLAEKLHGDVVLRDGAEATRFEHAGQAFEVWLDETQQWLFARVGEHEPVSQTALHSPETPVHQLLSQMMSEIKGTWGDGRQAGPRDAAVPHGQH